MYINCLHMSGSFPMSAWLNKHTNTVAEIISTMLVFMDITVIKSQTVQAQMSSTKLALPRHSIFNCGLDLIVIAAKQVFDPLGCVAATHGEVRLRIGRPERMGSRIDMSWLRSLACYLKEMRAAGV